MNTPLKIKFERRGGFSGIPLRVSLEAKDLPLDAQVQLRKMLQTGPFERTRSNPSISGPDRFVYHLTVINEDEEYTFEFRESEIPEEVRPLVEYLNHAARLARRPSQ